MLGYTAHAAVARPPTFPCDDPLNHPELCDPVQIASGVLDVDRTPEAVVEVSPPALITGDVLTLEGRGTEGHPSSCTWEALLDGSEPPVPAPSTCNPSSPVAQYQIPPDAPGEWTFQLTAHYAHPGPFGGPWASTDSVQREISSVAAAFMVYPEQPLSNEDVILCSETRATTANLGYSWEMAEELSFSALVTSFDSCTSDISECGSRCGWVVDEACFPDEESVYHARLTVTKLDHPPDASQFTDAFVVLPVCFQPAMTWTTPQPAVGQTVVLFITCVPEVDPGTGGEVSDTLVAADAIGRFVVVRSQTAAGEAVALTDDTGSFWFFDDANLELILKVLDGRWLNGHFWVFYGALSNVECTITITDTETGAQEV